jgi:two-component system, NtrC family, response regulator AtoC
VSSVQTSDWMKHAVLSAGSSPMRAIGTMIESIADTDATVLIRGESGVGKDLVARAIHAGSPRRHGPFVKVNCAAIPSELLESEFFGHEKGAFTGAHRRKPGQFECAHKGTIYLDEIGELPLALQAKLLHVLQDFRFSRVGGDGSIDVDSRVIAATNRNLEAAMARGEFRKDLYYRVNVVEIRVPPLRERREEIPALASWFLEKFNAQYGRQKQLSPETMTHLQQHPWSGNVRELENVVRRLVVLTDVEGEIEALVVRGRTRGRNVRGLAGPPAESLREIARRAAREAEREALKDVLAQVHWNRAAASRILKVSYKTLLHKIVDCGLTPPLARNRKLPGAKGPAGEATSSGHAVGGREAAGYTGASKRDGWPDHADQRAQALT